MKTAVQGVKCDGRGAFTIIELMAATAILSIILFVIFAITQQVSGAWKSTSAKIEAFQGARAAFAAMTRQIGQATLNVYYDYYDASGNRRTNANASTFVPAKYGRYSDLHFICAPEGGGALVQGQVGHAVFFQAPLGNAANASYAGMETLLNACGYYITYGKDPSRPAFLNDSSVPNSPPNAYRFRLMQYLQPSENLAIYDPAATSPTAWFKVPLASTTPPVQVLAENIVMLAILPRLSAEEGSNYNDLTSNYAYDSRDASKPATFHQLPPVLEVILVATDEASMAKLGNPSTAPDLGFTSSTVFQTIDATGDRLDADLETVTNGLESKRINFRVFRSVVPLRASKWSSS
jgi:uncharacterized protein (TIGR02599 family)